MIAVVIGYFLEYNFIALAHTLPHTARQGFEVAGDTLVASLPLQQFSVKCPELFHYFRRVNIHSHGVCMLVYHPEALLFRQWLFYKK
jgi:hypothetical protein